MAVYVLPSVLINIGAAAALVFQMLLGRYLSVAEFGAFNALLGVVNILWAPAGIVSLVFAHLAIGAGSTLAVQARLLNGALIAIGSPAAVVLLAGWIASDPIAARCGIAPGTVLGVLCAATWIYMHSVPVGLLQARRSYTEYAMAQSAVPIFRLLLGVVFVAWLGSGLEGAMWAVAIPVLIALSYALLCLADAVRIAVHGRQTSRPSKFLLAEFGALSIPQILIAICLAVLTNIDVVIVARLFPGEAAGLYSGAAVLSRVALLLPTAIAGMIFSESAHAASTGSKVEARIDRGLIITMALAATAATAVLLGAHWLLLLTFGARFTPGARLFGILSTAMAALSIAQAMTMHAAGRRDWRPLIPLTAMACAFPPAAILLSKSSEHVAWLLLAACVGAMMVSIPLALHPSTRHH
jgi:O-antigen/teichoic acid export membrane protein